MCREPIFDVGEEEAEAKVDAGQLVGDVILQVAVEASVAKVDFGGKGDEQNIEVKRSELEGLSEVVKA